MINEELKYNGFSDEDIEKIINDCSFDLNEFKFKIKEENPDNNSIIIETDSVNKNNSFNCSEINNKIIKFKNVEQYLFCKNNNFFNSSMIYIKDFPKEDKNELIKLLKKIESKIEDNSVDEKFLYNYLEKAFAFEK